MARVSHVGRRILALRNKVLHLPLRRRSVIGFGFAALLAVSFLGVLRLAVVASPLAAADNQEARPAANEAQPPMKQDSMPDSVTGSVTAPASGTRPAPIITDGVRL